MIAYRDLLVLDLGLYQVGRIWFMAFDTVLVGKATMRLDNLFRRHARSTLQGVDVLSEASVQNPFLRKQSNK